MKEQNNCHLVPCPLERKKADILAKNEKKTFSKYNTHVRIILLEPCQVS